MESGGDLMPWTPLDDGLLTSTLLKEGPTVVAIWALLLSMTDRYGVSKLQPSAAASLLRISDLDAEAAFKTLSSPDPGSRNKAEEGRRIKRTEDGYWEVVSYHKYQQMASKANAVLRQQRYQERKKKAEALKAGRPLCSIIGCTDDRVVGALVCPKHAFDDVPENMNGDDTGV
jgi:hypothetical protein